MKRSNLYYGSKSGQSGVSLTYKESKKLIKNFVPTIKIL